MTARIHDPKIGELAIMRAPFDLHAKWREHLARGGARYDFRLPAGAKARISKFNGRRDEDQVKCPLISPFPYFDQLADGSWIVADRGRRAERDAGGLNDISLHHESVGEHSAILRLLASRELRDRV